MDNQAPAMGAHILEEVQEQELSLQLAQPWLFAFGSAATTPAQCPELSCYSSASILLLTRLNKMEFVAVLQPVDQHEQASSILLREWKEAGR